VRKIFFIFCNPFNTAVNNIKREPAKTPIEIKNKVKSLILRIEVKLFLNNRKKVKRPKFESNIILMDTLKYLFKFFLFSEISLTIAGPSPIVETPAKSVIKLIEVDMIPYSHGSSNFPIKNQNMRAKTDKEIESKKR
jgi:hypothetical protein